jgi:hypothetical protein
MESVIAFVEALVVFDALAIVAALAIGVVVAPVLVIVHAGCEWKRRMKWIATCALTSWIGFWFYRRHVRDEAMRHA